MSKKCPNIDWSSWIKEAQKSQRSLQNIIKNYPAVKTSAENILSQILDLVVATTKIAKQIIENCDCSRCDADEIIVNDITRRIACFNEQLKSVGWIIFFFIYLYVV